MRYIQQTLVTIVSESVLEKVLIQEFDKFGIEGYTVSESHGKGTRGLRTGDLELNRNATFKLVCDRAVAEKLLEFLYDNYYDNYAFFAYLTTVEICVRDKQAKAK